MAYHLGPAELLDTSQADPGSGIRSVGPVGAASFRHEPGAGAESVDERNVHRLGYGR